MRLTILLTLLLAACGNNPRAVGNASYVGVGPVWTEDEALPLAELHCSKYGKTARFNRKEGVRAAFDCI